MMTGLIIWTYSIWIRPYISTASNPFEYGYNLLGIITNYTVVTFLRAQVVHGLLNI